MSRSEPHGRALEAYLEEHGSDGVTGRQDEVYAGGWAEESRLDPLVERIQAASTLSEDESW